MVSKFDPAKPETGKVARSAEIRDNFVSIATDHSGPLAPASPRAGYTWLDTNDPTNIKKKQYNGSFWVTLFEHLERQIPVVGADVTGPAGSTGATGVGLTGVGVTGVTGPAATGITGPTGSGSTPVVLEDSSWTTSIFSDQPTVPDQVITTMPLQFVGGFGIAAGYLLASEVVTEVGPTVLSDPDNVIASATFETSGDYRAVRLVFNSDNVPGQAEIGATATITWTWNGITFTIMYSSIQRLLPAPELYGVNPQSGQTGQQIQLIGYFPNPDNTTVTINGVVAPLDPGFQPTMNEIYVTAPANADGTYTLRVTDDIYGTYVETSWSYVPPASPPVVTDVFPTTGVPNFTEVTIYGSNFTPDNVIVYFITSGQQLYSASVLSSGTSEIFVVVPFMGGYAGDATVRVLNVDSGLSADWSGTFVVTE